MNDSPSQIPSRPSFAVIIPMFNEETGAERCVSEVCGELALIPQRCQLIAVDDGSSDRTGTILRKLSTAQPLLRMVSHGQNLGYGAALRTGAAVAHADGFVYALFMDSDLTNSPADIPRFAEAMSHDLDLIKATRYRAGGRMLGVPWRRRVVSIAGGIVARSLFRLPLSDCTNGFRAVKLNLLRRMNLRERGFPAIVEELYHSVFLARSFGEIPVVLASRGSGLRPTSFGYAPRTIFKYLKYCVLAFLRIPPGDQVDRSGEGIMRGC